VRSTTTTDSYSDGYNEGYDDGYDDGYSDAGSSASTLTKVNEINLNKEQTNAIIKEVSGLVIKWGEKAIKIPLDTIQNLISYDILRNMVFALALAALLGFLFDIYIFSDGEASFKQFLDKHRYTVIFICIFIFGSFLSISSIIAIPEVKKSNDKTGLYGEDFKLQIEKFTISKSSISNANISFNDQPYVNFQSSLTQILGAMDTVQADSANQIWLRAKKKNLGSLNGEISNIIRNSKNAVKKLKSLEGDYENKVKEFRNTWVNNYEYNTNGIGAAESVRKYFRDCLNYFKNYTYNYADYISFNNKRIQEKFESNLSILNGIRIDLNDKNSRLDYYFNQPEIPEFENFLYKPTLQSGKL